MGENDEEKIRKKENERKRIRQELKGQRNGKWQIRRKMAVGAVVQVAEVLVFAVAAFWRHKPI